MAADGSQFPIENSPSLTLSDVLARIEQHPDIDPRTCGEMASAIRKLCSMSSAPIPPWSKPTLAICAGYSPS